MTTNSLKRQAPAPKGSVLGWLLDSDPSIRWQVMRGLTDAVARRVGRMGLSAARSPAP
jgi:hypothetical protein